MDTLVQLENVTKRYGGMWALRECTLAIPGGHLAALVGPNGAGCRWPGRSVTCSPPTARQAWRSSPCTTCARAWLAALQVHHAYAAVAACHPASSPACQDLLSDFNSTYARAETTAALLQVVPVLIGAFVGAPVLARELETGTFRYAWTQGFGRWCWTVAKLVLLAVTVAAIAATLAVWSGLAITTGIYLRQRYLTPLTAGNPNLSGTAWVTSQWYTEGGKPVLDVPVDRGRLAARAVSAAHRHNRLAGSPPGGLNQTPPNLREENSMMRYLGSSFSGDHPTSHACLTRSEGSHRRRSAAAAKPGRGRRACQAE
jgi:hypothetical protein